MEQYIQWIDSNTITFLHINREDRYRFPSMKDYNNHAQRTIFNGMNGEYVKFILTFIY